MKEFTITKDHLLLIKAMNICYDGNGEFGAPAVDTKRPYGNSDVYQDIANIIGVPPRELNPLIYEDGEFSEVICKNMLKLHEETETALQICLITQSFVPGRYQADKYRSNWRLITGDQHE